eukprot:TCONS_00004893-protein
MAECYIITFAYIEKLPNELIEMICLQCNAGDLISISQTNRKFYILVTHMATCWKELCQTDFDIQLSSIGKFSSYREIYKLLYCSRMLMGCYTYGRYFNDQKLKMPDWLIHWAALSRQTPTMRYGKHRVKGKVRGKFLHQFADFPYGRIKKVYKLNQNDLGNFPIERAFNRTWYFSYESIKSAGSIKHGSQQKFTEFLLDKCHRSRGYIMRNHQKILRVN